jgi:hypothetical protein
MSTPANWLAPGAPGSGQADTRAGMLSKIGSTNGGAGWASLPRSRLQPSPIGQSSGLGSDPFVTLAGWLHLSPTMLFLLAGTGIWLASSETGHEIVLGVIEGLSGKD